MIAGGAVGGFVAHVAGLEAPLVVYAGVLAVAAVLFFRVIPTTRAGGSNRRSRPREAERERDLPLARRGRTTLGRLFRTPGFAVVMVVNLAYLWMVAAVFNTLVPFFAKDELGMSTVGIGVVFAVMLAAEFAVLYPAGERCRPARTEGRDGAGLTGLAVMTVLVGFTGTPIVFGLALALLGVASGYAGVPPAAMLADVTPGEWSGTRSAPFASAATSGSRSGRSSRGYSASGLGFEAAFAFAAAPTVVALLLVVRMRETLRPRRRPVGVVRRA